MVKKMAKKKINKKPFVIIFYLILIIGFGIYIYLPGCSSCISFKPIIEEYINDSNITLFTISYLKVKTKDYIITTGYFNNYDVFDADEDGITYKLTYIYKVDGKPVKVIDFIKDEILNNFKYMLKNVE